MAPANQEAENVCFYGRYSNTKGVHGYDCEGKTETRWLWSKTNWYEKCKITAKSLKDYSLADITNGRAAVLRYAANFREEQTHGFTWIFLVISITFHVLAFRSEEELEASWTSGSTTQCDGHFIYYSGPCLLRTPLNPHKNVPKFSLWTYKFSESEIIREMKVSLKGRVRKKLTDTKMLWST